MSLPYSGKLLIYVCNLFLERDTGLSREEAIKCTL